MRFFLLMLALVVTINHAASAQSAYPVSAEARQSAFHFSELYNLDADQTESIANIEARLERHLATILTLRQTDSRQYLEKLQAAFLGREHSIKNVLDSSQLDDFTRDAKWMRTRRAEQRIETVQAGGSLAEAEEKALSLTWEADPAR